MLILSGLVNFLMMMDLEKLARIDFELEFRTLIRAQIRN